MGNPLCILMITGEYPPMQGGVADYTQIAAQHLSSRGHTVHILTSTRAESDESDIVVHATMPNWRWCTLSGKLGELCKSIRPDVINIQYQTAAFEMRPFINYVPRMSLDAPVVTTFHDLRVPYLFPKAGVLRWQVNRALARSSAAVITTNSEDTHCLIRQEKLDNVHEIPIGSNITPILPDGFNRRIWRTRWDLPPNAPVLCYFGFLNESKGGEELIQAFDILVSQNPDAQLLFIGGATGASDPTNQEYATRVRRLIIEHHLGNNVHWTGHVSDQEVSAAFACSDICVLPFQDGISLRRGSLMAALVHGMPIVSTHPNTALPEIIHGQNLWLTNPNDPDALAQSVVTILADQALKQQLTAGARELSKRYNWDNITTRILEVFCDVLN